MLIGGFQSVGFARVNTGAYDAKLTNHETTERDLKDRPICLVSVIH